MSGVAPLLGSISRLVNTNCPNNVRRHTCRFHEDCAAADPAATEQLSEEVPKLRNSLLSICNKCIILLGPVGTGKSLLKTMAAMCWQGRLFLGEATARIGAGSLTRGLGYSKMSLPEGGCCHFLSPAGMEPTEAANTYNAVVLTQLLRGQLPQDMPLMDFLRDPSSVSCAVPTPASRVPAVDAAIVNLKAIDALCLLAHDAEVKAWFKIPNKPEQETAQIFLDLKGTMATLRFENIPFIVHVGFFDDVTKMDPFSATPGETLVCELAQRMCSKLGAVFDLEPETVFCSYTPPELLSYGPLISDQDLAPVAHIFNNLLSKLAVRAPARATNQLDLLLERLERMSVLPAPSHDEAHQALEKSGNNVAAAALALRRSAQVERQRQADLEAAERQRQLEAELQRAAEAQAEAEEAERRRLKEEEEEKEKEEDEEESGASFLHQTFRCRKTIRKGKKF